MRKYICITVLKIIFQKTQMYLLMQNVVSGAQFDLDMFSTDIMGITLTYKAKDHK